MEEDTYLKDNIKKCVDFAMNQDDETKRRILTGMFKTNDYLINEQLVVQALNDEEKKEWFNNDVFETKDKEIERLQNIIKETKEKIDNLGTCELLGTKYISKREVMKILDKENK